MNFNNNQLKKSTQIEIRHIIDEFIRVAMVHPEIIFSFHHNDKMVFHLNNSNLKQRITGLFGAQYSNRLVPVEQETEKIKTRFQDELSAIFNDAVSNYSGEYGDARREFEYVIVDAAKSRNPKAILEKNGFGKMDADGVVNFLNELKNA